MIPYLRTCPFCGSKQVETEGEYATMRRSAWSGWFHVICNDCGGVGPIIHFDYSSGVPEFHQDLAIVAWNKRENE